MNLRKSDNSFEAMFIKECPVNRSEREAAFAELEQTFPTINLLGGNK